MHRPEKAMNSSEKCKALALKYISMQIKTEGQVKDYLRKKGFEKDDVESAIDYLKEYKYINDYDYCKAYYREGCRKGKGRRRIEQELINKKVNKRVIADALDDFTSEDSFEYQELVEEVGTEKERALEVGRKMLRQHMELGKEADKNFMARVGRRLMTLGYDTSVLYSVIGTLMKEGKVLDDDYE